MTCFRLFRLFWSVWTVLVYFGRCWSLLVIVGRLGRLVAWSLGRFGRLVRFRTPRGQAPDVGQFLTNEGFCACIRI